LNSLRIIEKSLGEVEEVPVINQAVVVAERSCEQMLGLVNSLLDIAEMESGKMDIAAKPLSITQLCQELIATYVQFANDAGIILNSRIPEEMPAFSGDEEKLQRVFSNLIDNALKFTPAGGRVDISLRSLPDTLEISVADTGPGVPAEFKESIFERFSQIPTSGGRRRGTGLGLTFAKLAVEAHRGRIWVEDNPGGGSVFRIHLPLENPNNDEEEMRDADIRTS
jgi:signal transduction histidine kinase